ncbi:uncharacterized protein LOC129794536 [Lutzomyia longipalpis]|uniref:Secreted protein n=1 Tax=Lutzomyia longipalpis TaxID=7200 RepID=A0A1B0CF98_LUTLO|nr:uncharacterized protein LOC129794536 [Lutzomyia longipalpis]
MATFGNFFVICVLVIVLSCVTCDTPAKDYLFIRHISSTEERQLRKLCDEGDTLVSMRAVSVQMKNGSDFLCHTSRFIGHYWIKLEDFNELVSHRDNTNDLSPTHVILNSEEFIGLQEGRFCRVNLTAPITNCTPLDVVIAGEPAERETSTNATIEILIKFSKYPITASYESLRTYVIILIVVLMCCTFTAVVHVTQKSVSEWQKKLNHQYIFVVDNK